MISIISFLFQVTCASGIFYLYYHLALRNKAFHQYNRFYLLLSVLISLVVPFLNIPVYFSSDDSSFKGIESLTAFYIFIPETSDGEMAGRTVSWLTTADIFIGIYTLVAILFLLRILASLASIRKIIRSYPAKKIGKIQFLNTSEPGTPFSFFNWLFWDRKLEMDSKKGKQILRHEMFHINQRHSIDIIFVEIVKVVFWFNPFYHLVKKELKAIHEFLADRHALEGEEKWTYAETLLMQALGTRQTIVNPFFNNQIKRRIAMITNPQKTSHRYLRQLLVLPILAGVSVLFAFSYRNDGSQSVEKTPVFSNHNSIGIQDTGKPGVDSLRAIIFSPGKKSPTQEQMTNWTDEKVYGVWLDGKRIANNTLIKMKPSSVAFYTESKLQKNTVDYGKYYFQVNLMTKEYFEASFPRKSLLRPDKSIQIETLNKPENDPLIVVDDEISEERGIESLKNLNASDIESINILKGTSAIALYGEKGANGVIVVSTKKEILKKVEAEMIFVKAEIEPAFPGGAIGWRKFLSNNINAKVVNSAPAGEYSVVVMFIVDEEGEISSLEAITNHGYGLGEEALRIMKKSPRWLPGVQNGRKIKFSKKLLITFVSEK